MQVAIVVLHYENDALTNQCVESILRTTNKETVDIIVVDNCSPTLYCNDNVTAIIRTAENKNVKGMNYGFEYALRQNKYDYIVNFDNDIICLDNWLEPLIDVMEKDKSIGICGGKQWNENQTQFNSVGADLMGMLYRNVPEDTRSVVWIQGSFHMYRVSMMHKIGIHDERYETICSDCDYCLHAIDRGWKVVFVEDSSVIHIGNASYKGIPVASEIEDKINFTQKWLGIKFCSLLKTFNYDASLSHKIIISFYIDGHKTTYDISVMPTREATKIAKDYFKGKIDVVEVGSYLGNNAESLLRDLPVKNLYLVDNNTDGAFNQCKLRFANSEKVKIVEKSSLEAAKDFPDESFDFVYIDADHSYKAVKEDIQAWLPKVKADGILAGHDYAVPPERDRETFNVIDAVNDSFSKEVLHIGEEYLGTADWWIYKKDLCQIPV
jgi:hypothetical protein